MRHRGGSDQRHRRDVRDGARRLECYERDHNRNRKSRVIAQGELQGNELTAQGEIARDAGLYACCAFQTILPQLARCVLGLVLGIATEAPTDIYLIGMSTRSVYSAAEYVFREGEQSACHFGRRSTMAVQRRHAILLTMFLVFAKATRHFVNHVFRVCEAH